MSDFRGDHAEIVYQIFPDRFRNGNPKLTPKPGAWKWRGRPIAVSSDVAKLTASPDDQYTFFGGDFDGIRMSIPHLVSLGVTTVYFNPIFEARSVHRYDTVDYLKPAATLGSRADFDQLVDDLHDHRVKVFLDGVFNHTGIDHPWYIDPDVRKRMYIPKADGETMMWMNGRALPKLDTQSINVQQKIFEVLDCWSNVDGWRLDAAHLLPHDFLRDIRKHLAPKPIIIEDWKHSPHYFEKQLTDGITNFSFRDQMERFFIEDCSPETLLDRLRTWIDGYPRSSWKHCWNYLDNHDLARFRNDVHSRERLMHALVLKFTLPGTPLLFQGIEFGMRGSNPAESRAPVVWNDDEQEREILDLVRSLVAFRHEHRVLVDGSFDPVFADNRSRTLAFMRRDDSDQSRALIALNDGYQPCSFEHEFGNWALAPGEWRVEVRDSNGDAFALRSEARKAASDD